MTRPCSRPTSIRITSYNVCYTKLLRSERILKAAHVAAQIANGPARVSTVGLSEVQVPRNLYPVVIAPTDIEIAEKLELVFRADKAARGYDNRIKQVRAGYADEVRHVLTVTSDGGIS